jgi:hypothetical protein
VKSMTDKPPYEIVRQGEVDYVVVFCPEGHECIGQKVSDVMMPQRLVCANVKCNRQWDQTLPQIMQLEERNP